ncbi:MAG TPA: hypothetical protein PKH65_10665 [Bacteroidia bacterium]|nr:hypothetical protein [Bacteroidia bacterium]
MRKTKKLIYVFFTTLLLVGGAFNVDSENNANSIDNLKVMTIPNQGIERERIDVGSFSIEIPADWNLVESEATEKGYNFAIKGECSSVFCTNLIGTQYDVGSAVDFNSFCTNWLAEAQLSQFGIEYNGYTKPKNSAFDILLYKYSFTQSDVNILGLSYLIDFKNSWWVLTFMSEYNGSMKRDFINTTNKVIESIKI